MSPTQPSLIDSTSTDEWVRKKLKDKNVTIRIGTLFSGIGAIEHALHRLKLKTEIVFAGDIDPFVKKAYFANYEISEDSWHDDIQEFSAKKYKNKVDLIVGGSPCQSFSMAGKRGGMEDTRGTLFYDFARVIKECQPKIFIFENVRGLLNHDKGNTWKVIQNVFDQLGYSINTKILNSSDYGIPQSRNRVFVVGFKKQNTKFLFPKPIKLQKTMQDFLEDHTNSKYFLGEKGVKFVTKIKNTVSIYYL